MPGASPGSRHARQPPRRLPPSARLHANHGTLGPGGVPGASPGADTPAAAAAPHPPRACSNPRHTGSPGGVPGASQGADTPTAAFAPSARLHPTTAHWEPGRTPGALPRGRLARQRRCSHPPRACTACSSPPQSQPGPLDARAEINPWPTRSCKQGLQRDCPCPKGQALTCRNQSTSMILAKKYTWGSESSVCKFRMRAQKKNLAKSREESGTDPEEGVSEWLTGWRALGWQSHT